jgi:hypothetical protein
MKSEAIRTVCCRCGWLVRDGALGPGGAVSHGFCPSCAASWRAEAGLPALPAPVASEPRDRRAEDRDEAAAREAAWRAYQAGLSALYAWDPGAPTSPEEAYMRSLAVYRQELAANALRRMGIVR